MTTKWKIATDKSIDGFCFPQKEIESNKVNVQ